MKTSEIRKNFLNYFKDRGHEIVPSSSLVPHNDPTLLFTNAGMVQFKDVFLGQDERSYTRATSSQRCVRAGGKHNDLDNVGFTARHHTFFEMLGNFSFGDYFKRDAIQFAWSFLTEVLKLPEEKLWVSVFEDDDEAAEIWVKEIGFDANRISRCGEKDNFWSMGDVGPCGPCTEIFYDHGEEVAGGPPGTPEEDGDRYIEIWNIVFMQYNRDAQGVMSPLPKPSVDTGMGLERIAAVMQGVHNNYDIDLFQDIINAIRDLLSVKGDKNLQSMRVIADHIRSTSFLIADGVLPGNEGRSYVLRRIIRRAIRHGHRLGARDVFFHKLVAVLGSVMGEAYPELIRQQDHIAKVLLKEEKQFAETLDQGLKIFETAVAKLSGKMIPGEVLFKLYDTYGFPLDLTADLARERGLTIDEAGFEAEMAKQKEQSKASSNFSTQQLLEASFDVEVVSEFEGYDGLQTQSIVKKLFNDQGQEVESLAPGEGIVVLDKTPFYAESGGQVGDQGVLEFASGSFEVVDTQKRGDAIIHLGQLKESSLTVGDSVHAEVQSSARQNTALNHSATHLLHAALRKLLGDHVQQKGSLVDSERLRFDFMHYQPLSDEELKVIEHLVNQEIRANHEVETALMTPEAAQQSGAMALFGEKYGDEVRVLSMGEFSKELCGGTHVKRSGDIGFFKILSEGGIASGVRRIEAVTGARAASFVEAQQSQLKTIADLTKSSSEKVADKVRQLLESHKTLEKELGRLQGKLASSQGDELANQVQDVNGIPLLVSKLEGANPKSLRETMDQLKNKLGSAVILLAAVQGDKISLVAGVTKDLTGKVKAGDLVKMVAEQVGGKGGGRPDMAQAGGSDVAKLDEALTSVSDWVSSR